MIAACAAAAAELRQARRLIAELEAMNGGLSRRLEIEKERSGLLIELNGSRKAETEALQAAGRAKDETIAAKDAVIAAQDKVIAETRKQRSPFWKRATDIVIGIAVGAILR